MRLPTRVKSTPVAVRRSRRPHSVTTITSFKAGKIVPLVMIPLLREDSVVGGNLQIQFAMDETEELLMNPVNGIINTHFVPFSAFERFGGSVDVYDRSYNGQPPFEGEEVIPWLEKFAYGDIDDNEIHRALGLHGKATDQVSTMFVEAYNLVVNFRRMNKSPNLPQRTRLQKDLAEAMWPTSRLDHIVPDWDQASMDGEVALNVVAGLIPVKVPGNNADGTSDFVYVDGASGDGELYFGESANPVNQLFAEMQANGITISLSNIEKAKQMRSWALLRKQYAKHKEEWIIDMLMSGLTIPDQGLMHPMEMGVQKTVFGMARRFATDAANLDKQAVNGATVVTVPLRMPRIRTGGIIIVTAEALPEQLWERTQDPFLHLGSVADLPDFMTDELDTEKVEAVRNGYVDTSHADPTGLFGYAPLNHKFMINSVRVGGKFMRPTVDGTNDEVRQRFWAVENVNPNLGESFHLAKDVHQKPFKDTLAEPFEAVILGGAIIEGNTVFGDMLIESGDEYDTIRTDTEDDKIVKE